jgi:hypothetical protein
LGSRSNDKPAFGEQAKEHTELLFRRKANAIITGHTTRTPLFLMYGLQFKIFFLILIFTIAPPFQMAKKKVHLSTPTPSHTTQLF